MATKLEGGGGLSGRATKKEVLFCGFPKTIAKNVNEKMFQEKRTKL